MLSRRGMLAGMAAIGGHRIGGQPPPMNAPAPPSQNAAVVPGSRSVLRARTVIVFGPSGSFVGVFVYSPAPGHGNLIASVAAQAGTDPYGNAYFAGITTYESNLATNLIGGGFEQFVAGETGASSIDQDLDGAGHFGMLLSSPQQGTAAQMLLIPSQWGGGGVPQVVVAGSNANPVPATADLLEVQGAIAAVNANIQATGLGEVIGGGGLDAGVGSVTIGQAGGGLKIKGGANARVGTSVLAGGTVTVANMTVTASTIIQVNHKSIGPNAGVLGWSVNPGVSFTISSTNAADANSISWELIEVL